MFVILPGMKTTVFFPLLSGAVLLVGFALAWTLYLLGTSKPRFIYVSHLLKFHGAQENYFVLYARSILAYSFDLAIILLFHFFLYEYNKDLQRLRTKDLEDIVTMKLTLSTKKATNYIKRIINLTKLRLFLWIMVLLLLLTAVTFPEVAHKYLDLIHVVPCATASILIPFAILSHIIIEDRQFAQTKLIDGHLRDNAWIPFFKVVNTAILGTIVIVIVGLIANYLSCYFWKNTVLCWNVFGIFEYVNLGAFVLFTVSLTFQQLLK